MLKALVIFGAGVYTGVYIQQTYNVPPVDDPQKLWEKFTEFLEQNKKKRE